MFDKLNRKLKGVEDEPKTAEQLQEEKKKEEEKMKQRNLDSVVCLKDIDLKVKKGSFVCVIGKVGSGKSSLLSALIGDLLPVPENILRTYMVEQGFKKELNNEETEQFQSQLIEHSQKGQRSEVPIKIMGSVTYTKQVPWIRNRTVRENIIYNQPFDLDKYVDTMQFCELESDLVTLKAGDQTEIGESGVNLSGGQKARIGLARAVYQDKDIVLMDDPISALDAYVRQQIIKNIFFGVMKEKTRVLVTHALDFLNQADHIVLMDHGRIKAQGTYQEMIKIQEFQDLIELNQLNKETTAGQEEGSSKKKEKSTKDNNQVKLLTYPSKLTLEEKRNKMEEYGTLQQKEEGKILNDDADNDAEVTWDTFK